MTMNTWIAGLYNRLIRKTGLSSMNRSSQNRRRRSKSAAPATALESRQLLSASKVATVNVQEGYLVIVGRDSGNHCTVKDSGSNVIVTINKKVHTFHRSQITTGIVGFQGQGGVDYFTSYQSTLVAFAYGGAGADELHGGSGDDYLSGEEGNDKVNGYAGDDYIVGGNGNDTLTGGTGDDILDGGAGDDDLWGGGIFAIVNAAGDLNSGGNDQDEGHDQLYGREGSDRLYAGAGNDFLDGGNDNDRLDCGPGDDIATGGHGNDYINGSTGNDNLVGGEGHDALIGGLGVDALVGNEGNDFLDAGAYQSPPGVGEWIDGGQGVDVDPYNLVFDDATYDDIVQGQSPTSAYLVALQAMTQITPPYNTGITYQGYGLFDVQVFTGATWATHRVEFTGASSMHAADVPVRNYGNASADTPLSEGEAWATVLHRGMNKFRGVDYKTLAGMTKANYGLGAGKGMKLKDGLVWAGGSLYYTVVEELNSKKKPFNQAFLQKMRGLLYRNDIIQPMITLSAPSATHAKVVKGLAYQIIEIRTDGKVFLRNPWGRDGGTQIDGGDDGVISLTAAEFASNFTALSYSAAALGNPPPPK